MIVYPYPMHLSNGYTYMLSISQFLNSLADFEHIFLLSLDNQEQFKNYLKDNIGINLHKNLNIVQIQNRKFGVKSNKLFFKWNMLQYLCQTQAHGPLTFYTRDFKQMKNLLNYRHFFPKAHFVFEVHQILSQNYCRSGQYALAKKMQQLERYVFKHVDALVCITPTLSNEISRAFKDATSARLILPVGFSEKFLDIKSNSVKEYDLIYSGNFSHWKGIEYLLKALRKVIDLLPNFKAILIGANQQQHEHYTQAIHTLNLETNVMLLKRVEHQNIINYVSKSKIGVLSNSYEGDGLLFTSPLKLYEYLGAGIKTVCSRLPSVESSIDSQLIYWAQPENTDALYQAIIEAYHDDKDDFSKRKAFAANFTWRKRAQKFSEFIKNLN